MECFEKLRTVGSGSFGRALLVRKRQDGQLYVIKQIDLSQLCGRLRCEALSEARVLSTLRHPHVVSYHGSFQESESLCIVMDYCEGGDLFQRINTQKGIPFCEEQVVHWLAQLCLALKYIHERKILHRDIKSQNIFLNKGMVKLGDFGIARVLNSTTELARTCIGTPYYLSPEICENKPYNHKSDMWALGCVLYELCTLRHAFEAGNMKNLVLKIVRGAYPPISTSFSPGLRVLIGRLLGRSPRLRPSAAQVLQGSLLQACLPKLLSPQDLLQEFGIGLKRPPPAGSRVEPSAKKPTTRTPGSRVTGPAAKYGVPVVKRPIKKAIRNPSVRLHEEHKRRFEEQKHSFITQARLEGWRLVLGLGDKAPGVKPKIGVHAAQPAACDDPDQKHKVVPQIPVSTRQTVCRGDRAQDKPDASSRREAEGLGNPTALKGLRHDVMEFWKLKQEALQNKARVEGHLVKQHNACGNDQKCTQTEVPSSGGVQKVWGQSAAEKDQTRERKKWSEAKNVPLSLAVPLADVDEEEEEKYLEIEKRKQWVLQPPPTVLQILDCAHLLTQTFGSPSPPPSLTSTQKERDEILQRVEGESEAQGLGTQKPGSNIKDQLDEVGDLWREKTPEKDKITIEDLVESKKNCQDAQITRKVVDIQLVSEVVCEGKGVFEIDITPEYADNREYVEKKCEVVGKKQSVQIGEQGVVGEEEQGAVWEEEQGAVWEEEQGAVWEEEQGAVWEEEQGAVGEEEQRAVGVVGAVGVEEQGAEEQGAEEHGAEEQGAVGAEEQGAVGAEEQGAVGAEEQGAVEAEEQGAVEADEQGAVEAGVEWDEAGKEIEGDSIEKHVCTEMVKVNGNLENELVKPELESLKAYSGTNQLIQGNIDDLEELRQDEEENVTENEKLPKPFACWAEKPDNVEQKACNESKKGDVAGAGDGSIARYLNKRSTNVSCGECNGEAEYKQIDLEGLHSSQDKLLHEKDSDVENDINSKHANELAPMKKNPVGEFEHGEVQRGTEGMQRTAMQNNIDVQSVHLKTIFEDEEEDNCGVEEEEDEKGSIFSRLECLRDQLECEMGFHLLHRVYLAIEASHEDEDALMLEGSAATKRLIPSHFLHLYPQILHLVMADGAYQEGNSSSPI